MKRPGYMHFSMNTGSDVRIPGTLEAGYCDFSRTACTNPALLPPRRFVRSDRHSKCSRKCVRTLESTYVSHVSMTSRASGPQLKESAWKVTALTCTFNLSFVLAHRRSHAPDSAFTTAAEKLCRPKGSTHYAVRSRPDMQMQRQCVLSPKMKPGWHTPSWAIRSALIARKPVSLVCSPCMTASRLGTRQSLTGRCF